MSLSLIAAVAKNNVIGKNNSLPWHIPEDFAFFKKMTIGKTILMGRRTFESLGKPLPNRKHLVITRQTDYKVPEGVELYHTIEAALAAYPNEDIMVIGGGDIYRQVMDRADTLYITRIDAVYEGDTAFPFIDPAVWKETWREDHPGFCFVRYERI